MARKSAKSKGYRKSTGKKPYLSKRDILILCAVVALVALGAILLFSYDDGALKMRGGKIADAGENWLVVNGALNNSGRRYYKLAEMGEIDGYAMEKSAMPTDENLSLFTYTPEDEAAGVRSIAVSCNAASAERLARYYASLLTEYAPSALATAEAGDLTYSYFTYTDEGTGKADEPADAHEHAEAADAHEGEADAEAAEEARIQRGFNAYVDAPEHGAVSVHITCEADAADALPDDEALKAVAAKVISAIKFEEKR